jgi:C-terminal processing protease CtpA/Prc
MTSNTDTARLVDALLAQLDAAYVFPERAAQAARLIGERLEAGDYDGAAGPDLCRLISADLFAACADKHLRLIWHDTPISSPDEAELHAALREQIRLENHGVRRLEVLPDNIGLIELTIIPEPSTGGANLAAAMQLVENTDALILDLRATRGGSPDGVAFLASHLFPDGELHLSDLVEGPNGPTRQYWTSAYVPGPRYLDRPVCVLTSSTTFSGGEALAYDLQAHGRAVVLGETTRGGAHPSIMVPLTEQIELRIPVARTISAATGSNWEGIGVQPDIALPAADALDVARLVALDKIGESRVATAA